METMTIQYNPASSLVRPVIELLQQVKGIRIVSRSDASEGNGVYATHDDVPLELRKQIVQARKESEQGETVVRHTHEEMQRFFDSL